MYSLKKFWEKKKTSLKFAKAGQGYRLDQDSPNSTASSSRSSSSHPASTSESKSIQAKNAAAEAALRRNVTSQEIQNRALKLSSYKSYPVDFMREEKAKMLKEEEEEKKETKPENKVESEINNITFNCPSLNLYEYMPLAKLREQIENKFKHDFEEDPVIMNALIIQNCNDVYQSEQCLSTLNIILSNLKKTEEENFEKYRKVKKVKIKEKILGVKGGTEFLESIGFRLDEEDEWYVFQNSLDDLEPRIDCYLDILKSCERCSIEFNRNAVVTNMANLKPYDEDYNENDYELTPSEIAREQQALKDICESYSTLMTSEMRKKLETKNVVPKFTRLRVKIPKKSEMLEVTFRTKETFNDFLNWLFVTYPNNEWDQYEYTFGTYTIPKQSYSKTFQELDLMPFATFHLKKT